MSEIPTPGDLPDWLPSEGRLALLREEMVADLEMFNINPKVFEVMRKIPRHIFVPEDRVHEAYVGIAIPYNGEGIDAPVSQASVIAVMISRLPLTGEEKILEIGTGTGYQAALLSQLVKEVYSIDVSPKAIELANENLARLGIKNVSLRAGDGMLGWEEVAPFDGIIIAAAVPPMLPRVLARQLRTGGRLVVPMGIDYQEKLSKLKEEQQLPAEKVPEAEDQFQSQCGLVVLEKDESGEVTVVYDARSRPLFDWFFRWRFTPIQGEYGWANYLQNHAPKEEGPQEESKGD